MAVTYKNKFGFITHHKNPSGCHNKVRFLLDKMKHSMDNYDKVYESIYYYIGSKRESMFSWEDAFVITRNILMAVNNKNITTIKYFKYNWVDDELNKERSFASKKRVN